MSPPGVGLVWEDTRRPSTMKHIGEHIARLVPNFLKKCLQALDGRKGVAELLGHILRHLVGGDSHRLVKIAHDVVNERPVCILAGTMPMESFSWEIGRAHV